MTYKSGFLFYRTPSGKVKYWYVQSFDNRVVTFTGDENMPPKASSPTSYKALNVGRSNQRSPSQVAEDKAKSMERDKLASGYRRSIHELLEQDKIPRAMLAKANMDKDVSYVKRAIKNGNCYVQPKLDGFRCLADARGLWSRELRKTETCPHIEEALKTVFNKYPELVIDGELFNFELREDFTKIQSLLTKKNVDFLDTLHCEDVIELHVYDCLLKGNFLHRYKEIRRMLDGIPHIKIVKTIRVGSFDSIYENHSKFLIEGYEGTMVRVSDKEYEQQKRPRQLIKVKEQDDEEFVIVGFVEGKGQWSGCAKSVNCVTSQGKTFSSGCAGSMGQMSALLSKESMYVGGKATVFFNGKFPSGVPRFPVAKKFFML